MSLLPLVEDEPEMETTAMKGCKEKRAKTGNRSSTALLEVERRVCFSGVEYSSAGSALRTEF